MEIVIELWVNGGFLICHSIRVCECVCVCARMHAVCVCVCVRACVLGESISSKKLIKMLLTAEENPKTQTEVFLKSRFSSLSEIKQIFRKQALNS